MRLKPEQLTDSLQRRLAAIYLICGDEPLQLHESSMAIRAAALRAGYSVRENYTVEAGFDWSTLRYAAASLSLFGDKKLIELRIPNGKIPEAGATALVEYCRQTPDDTVLLVVLPTKLDKTQQKSAWLTALDQRGVIIQAWPIEAAQLPSWIASRLRAKGLQPNPQVCAYLAEYLEGNLLAVHQEIEKLLLLYGPGPLDAAQVEAALVGNARYTVYALAEASLATDAPRTLRILSGLQEEEIEPTLVLWALARDLRVVAGLAATPPAGAELFRQYNVWGTRQGLLKNAAQRLGTAGAHTLLQQAARCDRIIKGAERGAAWEALRGLALGMAGKPL